MSQQRTSSLSTPGHNGPSSNRTRPHLTNAMLAAAIREASERLQLNRAMDALDESGSTPQSNYLVDGSPNATIPESPLTNIPTPGASSSPTDASSTTDVPHNRVRLAPDPVDGVIEIPGALVKKMWDCYPKQADKQGVTWKRLSQKTVDFYWGEFHKVAVWDPEHDKKVKAEWGRKNVERYKDYTKEIRDGKRPYPSDLDLQREWKAYWKSPPFLEKQKKAKKNRRGGDTTAPALPTHTAGSKTHRATRKHLEDKEKRPISLNEVHEYCHTRKHEKDKWLVPKAQEVQEKFQLATQSLTQQYGEDAVDKDRVFYEVVGGHDKKKALPGLGSLAKTILPGYIAQPPLPPSIDTNAITAIHQQLAELIATVKDIAQRQVSIREGVDRLLGGHQNRPPSPDVDGDVVF